MEIKKVLSLVGASVLAFSVGCGQQKALEEPMDIATLNGPTGMGMTKVIADQNKNYRITIYQSPDEITGKIISGELEIACVPSNLAAVLNAKTKQNICLLGVNTLGVLYLVEKGESLTDLSDLRGKKILASGQGSTPEYILNQLLEGVGLQVGKDVEVQYFSNHTEVVGALLADESTIALLPEPHVTIAMTKAPELKSAMDLNAAWEKQEGTKLPMGVMIARADFVKDHPKELESFLEDYSKSVVFVNTEPSEAAKMMVQAGLFEKAEIAEKAIPNAHIVWEQGQMAKNDLDPFYKILKDHNPKAIGGNLPDESFYYSK